MPTVQGFQSLEINVEGDDVSIRQGEEQIHFPVSYLQVVIAQMRAAVKTAPTAE